MQPSSARLTWKSLIGTTGLAVLYGLVEGLAVGYVLLAIAMRVYPENVWIWCGALWWFYVFGALFRLLFPVRIRGIFMLALLVCIGGMAYGWFGKGVDAILLGVLGFVCSLRGVMVAEGSSYSGTPMVLWFGLFGYVPAYLLYLTSDLLMAYAPALKIMGICLFAAVLLMSNRINLREALFSMDRTALPRRLTGLNLWLVVGFAGIVLLLASWDAVAGWLKTVVGAALGWLLGLLGGSGSDATPLEEEVPQILPPMMEQKEPSLFWQILQWVLIPVVVVCVAAGILMLLYMAVKGIVQLIRWLGSVRPDLRLAADGFTDEVYSIRRRRKDRKPTRKAHPDKRKLDELPDEEKVRRLYAMAVERSVKRGLKWSPSLTPKETAEEMARLQQDLLDAEKSDLYGAVRYGGKRPDPGKVAEWLNRVMDKTKREP